jgi:hypothetical protein
MNKIALLILISTATIFHSNAQRKVSLQEGSTVRVRILETLSSASSKAGEQVNMEVSEDVLADGKIVIARGAKAIGTITVSEPSKMMGKKGKIDFTIDYVTDVNGKNIRLRSAVKNEGKGSQGGVIAAAVIINPLLIFIKGKNITVEKDKIFPVYVDRDYEIVAMK